jgi:hypothetical protein
LADADTGGATFKLPLSSSEVVIEYHRVGGLARVDITTQLFGDGRLLRTERSSAGRITSEELGHLELVEMESIVQLAVEGELVEATQADLHRTDDVLINDAVRTTLTINLADYARPGRSSGPARMHLQLQSPSTVARFNKDNPRIATYATIAQRIARLEVSRRGR